MHHTQTPWQIEGFDIMSDDTVIASINEMAELPFNEIQHNALLIAAAPKLLIALKWLLSDNPDATYKQAGIELAKEAIEQATKFPD